MKFKVGDIILAEKYYHIDKSKVLFKVIDIDKIIVINPSEKWPVGFKPDQLFYNDPLNSEYWQLAQQSINKQVILNFLGVPDEN